MREIKFRVWDEYNKEMLDIENLYWDETTGDFLIRTTMYNDFFDTKDMILMQYTGLKDKKSKKIYEGDILKIENIDYAKVYYDEDRMAWGLQEIGEWYLDSPLLSDNTNLDLLVVGNIYDNPELLD